MKRLWFNQLREQPYWSWILAFERFVRQQEHFVVWWLFVWAVSLRWLNLHVVMPFTYDQGRDLLLLAEMALGDIKLVGPTTGISGVFLGPWYYYWLLLGFWLGDGSPVVVGYWSALTICVGYVLTYYGVLKPIVGRKTALLGYFWLLVAPGALEASRLIWNPSLTPVTIAVMLSGLLASVRTGVTRKTWWLALGALGAGLSLHTELAYAIFLGPVVVVWLGYYWIQKKYSWQQLCLAVVMVLATLMPQVLFELKHNFIMTRAAVAELHDTSKQVSFQQVWRERPAQMRHELERQLLTGKPYPMVLGLGLVAIAVFGVWRQRDANSRLILAVTAAPLVGLLFHRGNYGFFFEYYLSPHFLLVIIWLIIAMAGLGPKLKLVATGVILSVMGLGFIRYWPIVSQPNLLQYSIGHELMTLRLIQAHGQATEHRPLGVDVFVPNLLPTQYQYLAAWIQQLRPDAPALDFLITQDHDTYYLVWEPSYDPGSVVAYQHWRDRMTAGADCRVLSRQGIITTEVCVRTAEK